MSELRLETYQNQTAFVPGSALEGIASWQVDQPPRSAEVRLIWYTQGKGTRDVKTVSVQRFDNPQPTDSQIFQLTLPGQPYSFSGKLISLVWALELVLEPGNLAQRLEITIGPGGKEVELPTEASKNGVTPFPGPGSRGFGQWWRRRFPSVPR